MVTITKAKILSIITEISEALSLSNDPQQLLGMFMDTLTEEWVTFATIDDLFTFLRRQIGATLDADQDETGV